MQLLLAVIIVTSLFVISLIFSRFKTVITNLFIAISSISMVLTASDLVLRNFSADSYRLYPNPTLPLTKRYAPNIESIDETFGDLSIMLGTENFGKKIYYKLETDIYGFTFSSDYSSLQNSYNLLVLGDSYAESFSFSQNKSLSNINHSWADLITKGIELTVYNLSISGTSPWEQYLNLSNEVQRLDLHPNTTLLWCMFSGNDLDDNYGETTDLSKITVNSYWKSLAIRIDNFRERSSLVYLINNALSAMPDLSNPDKVILKDFMGPSKILFFKPYVDRTKRTYGEVLSHSNYKMLESTITAMSHLTMKRNIKLKLLLFPCKEEIYSWVLKDAPPWATEDTLSGFSVALNRLCIKYNIDFHDLKPFFVERSKRVYKDSAELLWHNDDTHWNGKGNEAAADFILKHVLKEEDQ